MQTSTGNYKISATPAQSPDDIRRACPIVAVSLYCRLDVTTGVISNIRPAWISGGEKIKKTAILPEKSKRRRKENENEYNPGRY